MIPEESFQAVLSNSQKLGLANESFELMPKSDGSIIANDIKYVQLSSGRSY